MSSSLLKVAQWLFPQTTELSTDIDSSCSDMPIDIANKTDIQSGDVDNLVINYSLTDNIFF
jgi:hypothetical protein